jgi:hypothetical protein
VAALADHRTLDEERVLALRFQLFSGIAGAIAAAVDFEAVQAVFLVHEFVTAGVDDEKRRRNANDLHGFGTTVFGVELPIGADAPWCVGPVPFAGSDRLSSSVQLFIAKAMTDLRRP